jgi:hypothetical protein
MLARIEALAEVSVARGCGFAGLAILTLMLGLSWDFALACKVGGLLTLFVCLVLAAKAGLALRRPVRNTELWMLLERRDRPHPELAQSILGQALRTCYLRFALNAALLAVALLSTSLVLDNARPDADHPIGLHANL